MWRPAPFQSRGRFYPVFAPVTDSFLPAGDRLLPEDPDQLLRRGNFVKVPVMTGLDADDGLLMLCTIITQSAAPQKGGVLPCLQFLDYERIIANAIPQPMSYHGQC